MTTSKHLHALATLLAMLAALLNSPLLSAATQTVTSGTCDPTKQSCAPAPCSPLDQALGKCNGSGSGDGGGMCTPAGGGDTSCGGGGAASQGGGAGGGVQVGAGNPINLVSGNKHQQETDLPPLPGVLGLEFKRYYNSDSHQRGLVGVGWRSSYETVLVDRGGQIQIVQADGRRFDFARSPGATTTLCTSPSLADGQVRIEQLADGSRQYHWRWQDGRTLTFGGGSGGGHPLQAITAASGERVVLSYNPLGELMTVRDPAGRQLRLVYGKAGAGQRAPLQAIETPLGRIGYEADDQGRLRKVAWFAAAEGASSAVNPSPLLTRQYHYEAERQGGNLYALTGISVHAPGADGKASNQRLSTYAYDDQGRAVLSTKGLPLAQLPAPSATASKPASPTSEPTGIEQVNVKYLAKALPMEGRAGPDGIVVPQHLGRVQIINSLGQATEVLSAVIGGHYRLIQMRGPGCATCGPSNMRYGYDSAGRLVRSTRLDDQGRPIDAQTLRYDGYGRLIEQGRIDFSAVGKAGAPQWRKRYDYTDTRYPDGSLALAPQPSLIAMPSVVAGQEHRVQIQYNALWQPTQVTESGYSPLDAQGQPKPTPITRSTRYDYSTVNGRSLLTQIDGPLPNGPKGDPSDSDITRLSWDAAGNALLAVTKPMVLTAKWQYDSVGRTLQAIRADGIIERYSYGPGNPLKPAEVNKAGRVWHFEYNPLGQAARVSDDQGRGFQLHHDLAGRLVRVLDAQGYAAQVGFNSEGLPTVSALFEPGQAIPLRATYRWFDELGRPTRQLQPDGRLDTWRYDGQSRVSEHVDGEDVMHLRRVNDATGLQANIDLSTDGLVRMGFATSPNAQQASLDSAFSMARHDDFGRRVLAWLPGQGLRTWTFDAGSQWIVERRIDNQGRAASTFSRSYDAAGRLIDEAVETVASNGKRVGNQQQHRSYEGTRLHSIGNAAEDREFAYDEFGRVQQTVVRLKGPKGQTLFETAMATRYDPASGEPIGLQLADSSELLVELQMNNPIAKQIRLREARWSRWAQKLTLWLPLRVAHALAGLLPTKDLLQDLQFHPYNGITQYTLGNGMVVSKTFDKAGRMTALSSTMGAKPLFRQAANYDVGTRIQGVEQTGLASADAPAAQKAVFKYNGFGELSEPLNLLNQRGKAGPAHADITTDAQGRVIGDGQFGFDYSPTGQIVAVYDPDRVLVARYTHNAQGQRVSKEVVGGKKTLYLWFNGKLAAEIDGSETDKPEITAQYVYLKDSAAALPIAKIEAAHAIGNSTQEARVLFIQNDYRGQPLAMIDQNQNLVWVGAASPYGFIQPASQGQQKAVLNIRLPGQYFDAETGLHDNWHRTYDARPHSALRGRYLSPDPLGYPDGPDAYAYGQGDPINHIDPEGLYEIDVHYYMTFFLARMAGVSYQESLTIALAAQYIDENPDTWPVDEKHMPSNILDIAARRRLSSYHFTTTNPDLMTPGNYDPSRSVSEMAYYVLTGEDLQSYTDRRYKNPANPQLSRLNNTVVTAPTKCSRAQFMGEYLHAFEDTFGHRSQLNAPVDLNIGLGHGAYGHSPDKTFNHSVTYSEVVSRSWPENIAIGEVGDWNQNEDRSYEMEYETFVKLRQFNGTTGKNMLTGKPIMFRDIYRFLQGWNKIQSTDDKIFELSMKLDEFGMSGGLPNFNVNCAAAKRKAYLGKLDAEKYPGAILPNSSATQAEVVVACQ